jgi:hypothetical protein
MSVDYKAERFDVDGDGVPCVITPSLDGNVITLISREAMDIRIAQLADEKEDLILRRDQWQVKVDAATTAETDLTALRATATADP